jgi:hypothetical protein
MQLLNLREKQTRGRKPPAQMKGNTMRINTPWLAALTVVAALAAAQTSRAITFGELDNGRHPNVGAVMVKAPYAEPFHVRHLDPSQPLPGRRAWDLGNWIWDRQ